MMPEVEFINPMIRDYRGQEDQEFRKIVEGDKADIESCHFVIVNYSKPSVGTSMEILHAWLAEIPVLLIDQSGAPLSPWLRYHSSEIVQTTGQAIERLREMMEDF